MTPTPTPAAIEAARKFMAAMPFGDDATLHYIATAFEIHGQESIDAALEVCANTADHFAEALRSKHGPNDSHATVAEELAKTFRAYIASRKKTTQ